MAGKKTRPAPKNEAAGTDPRLTRLKELVKILEGSTLGDLSYEDSDIKVSLGRTPKGTVTTVAMQGPAVHHAPAPTHTAASAPASAPAAAKVDENVVIVKSPFVGTFYSAPKPGAPPFTQVGERVRRGQTICIIEAMKLMNEIEAEADGVVLEIVAENGKAVQYGDALFKLKKG
ncbi:MAG: acetyl-CoA carboxylase biotin carboxyl carrier protein [Myxococcota bacterium]